MTVYVLMSVYTIITELPHRMKPSLIQVMEGTERCTITVVSTNRSAVSINWEKDGKRIQQGINGFAIAFNNITRKDTGNYSLTGSIVCHDDKTKLITENFALNVIRKCS